MPVLLEVPQDIGVVDHLVCGHHELWLGVPLVVGDEVPGLQPDPLLAFGEEAVVAAGALARLHEGLVAGGDAVQVVKVVVVVARRAQELEGEVADYLGEML